MKQGVLAADWFFGLVFSLLFFIFAYISSADSFQRLETAAYDLGMRLSESTPSDRIAIIEIDDASIAALGRWPWPRTLQADLIDRLSQGGAKIIASTVLYSEPQRDPGLQYIENINTFFDESALATFAPAIDLPMQEEPAQEENVEAGSESTDAAVPVEPELATSSGGDAGALPETSVATDAANTTGDEAAETEATVPVELTDALGQLRTLLSDAATALNTDQQLAISMLESGRVILPMTFSDIDPIGRPDHAAPDFVYANAINNITEGAIDIRPIKFGAIQPPIATLGDSALAIGHLVLFPDLDGALRFEPLAIEYDGVTFPSFSLAVAANSLNLSVDDIRIKLGEGVQLGRLEIRTTPDLFMYNHFYQDQAGQPAFKHYSFADVVQDVVPIERFRDKIVLIGATALGVGDSFPTPVSANMAPVTTIAHTISAILQEDFFTRPDWAPLSELAVFLLLAIYLIALLPRLKPGSGALLTFAILFAMLATEFTLLTTSSMWLQLIMPAVFLLTGHLLITIKMFRVTEKIRVRSEEEGAESNRMLGLAFQSQGQLDMAFDKFRKCPMDASVMDALYNLALDYERKRQFNKAGSVYNYMMEYDPNYKDLKQRTKRSKAMEETIMLGGAGAHPGGTLMLDGDEVQKPMLGRYQVEKELGKGAMGVVYQGRDPKINRVVAIKTMALSQEFEPDELDEVKERFFREAETAGRLNHPHIVTIFDAGEEHDLAYIAMEFLKGKDLVPHTKADNLLAPGKVMEIIANAADALDYAHQQNVVHRDIKPANMMYEAESGMMKLTDFGIARITDSSKTKTGMVLGTPSYMSPEQLAGTRVDGRSDLFSLGVTLYQMLTGQLPFRADSMATLMYKIANENHAPATLIRPELPPCVDAIIDKALAKNVEQRYARGAELAADIRACAGNIAV